MAKAYICDRCGEAKQGGPEGRLFLESHVLKNTRGSAVLLKHEDLCSACVSDILRCAQTAPAREAGPR